MNLIERAEAWLAAPPRSTVADPEPIIANLLAIVKRLPVTADGAAVVPGMDVWILPMAGLNKDVPTAAQVDMITTNAVNHQPEVLHVHVDAGPMYGGYTPEARCYSTPEAAQAARESNGQV